MIASSSNYWYGVIGSYKLIPRTVSIPIMYTIASYGLLAVSKRIAKHKNEKKDLIVIGLSVLSTTLCRVFVKQLKPINCALICCDIAIALRFMTTPYMKYKEINDISFYRCYLSLTSMLSIIALKLNHVKPRFY